MTSKTCSYCEATPNPKVSLAEQGWTAVVINIGKGANHKRLHRRACPKHKEELSQEMTAFLDEMDGAIGGK